jgi:SAM-dependent methyltransferase
MTEPTVYNGKDLEAMSFAVNYHEWILDEFRRFLGKRVVEVGAGTGSFSELLLREKPESLILVEPSEMFAALRANISAIETETAITFHRAIFAGIADRIDADSIVYVNVLEHIEDDRGELEIIYRALKPGGRLFIFVPALRALFGEFDRRIGHFRRYRKKEIEEKCRAAGFRILKSKYFDLAGIFPWFVKYKLLGSDSLESGAVTFYDKFAVPIVQKFEKILPAPIGKNVLMIVEK